MTTGKPIALTRQTFVAKLPLLFNMLSRLVITFLPRSKDAAYERKERLPYPNKWTVLSPQNCGCPGVVPRPAASVSPRSLLEMQILRPYLRPTEL